MKAFLGFVFSVLLLIAPANAEVICNTKFQPTNVRKGPGANDFPTIATLPNGAQVEVVKKVTNSRGYEWVKVIFKTIDSKTEQVGFVTSVAISSGCIDTSTSEEENLEKPVADKDDIKSNNFNNIEKKFVAVDSLKATRALFSQWDSIAATNCQVVQPKWTFTKLSDSTSYYGKCQDGKANGFGLMSVNYSIPDNNLKGKLRYMGFFRNGHLSGKGAFHFDPSNSPEDQEYQLHAKLVNGSSEGFGLYENWGVKYEGQYKNDSKNGNGVMTFSKRYIDNKCQENPRCIIKKEGRFSNGEIAFGVITSLDGTQRKGTWNLDENGVLYPDAVANWSNDVAQAYTVDLPNMYKEAFKSAIKGDDDSSGSSSGSGGNWGALAVDYDQGEVFGFAHNYASKSEAESRALSECKNRGGSCKIRMNYSSGCAAYAVAQDGGDGYGWDLTDSESSAKSGALSNCSAQGSSCTVRVWSCN